MTKPLVIAVQGIKGGVGATSVVAHLAAALQALGNKVFALDLCQQNSLALYFNLPFSENGGLAVQIAQQQDWREACYTSETGIWFSPFGCDFSIDLNHALSQHLENNPFWLEQNLASLSETLYYRQPLFVLLDVPRYPDAIANAAIAAADLIISVMESDAASYACMLRRHQYNLACNGSSKHKPTPRRFLLNSYTPAHSLERDVSDLLQTELAGLMVPFVIHADQTIREAIAHKQNAVEGAFNSQANRDFKLLATWCLGFFNKAEVKVGKKRPDDDS